MRYIILAIICLSLLSCAQSAEEANQAALEEFKKIEPNKFLPNRCTIGLGISCTEFKVESDGRVMIVVMNNLGEDAANFKIILPGCDPVFEQDIFEDGDRILVSFDCGKIEDRLRKDIEVYYTKIGEQVSRTIVGILDSVAE